MKATSAKNAAKKFIIEDDILPSVVFSLCGLYPSKSTIPAGRVGSGRVGWLDNWGIMLNSALI